MEGSQKFFTDTRSQDRASIFDENQCKKQRQLLNEFNFMFLHSCALTVNVTRNSSMTLLNKRASKITALKLS